MPNYGRVCDVLCLMMSVWWQVCDVKCVMSSLCCRFCDVESVMSSLWCQVTPEVSDVVMSSVWCWVWDVCRVCDAEFVMSSVRCRVLLHFLNHWKRWSLHFWKLPPLIAKLSPLNPNESNGPLIEKKKYLTELTNLLDFTSVVPNYAAGWVKIVWQEEGWRLSPKRRRGAL